MYNETRFKNALRAPENVHLTSAEKNKIRAVLQREIRNGQTARTWETWHDAFRTFMIRPLVTFVLAALVIIGSGGAAALGAESSLPGDLLYPIKTRLNEPMAGLLRISPLEKATFELHLVERRLVEAESLAESTFSAQRETIRTNVEKQRAKAESFARKLIEKETSAIAVATPARTLVPETAVMNAGYDDSDEAIKSSVAIIARPSRDTQPEENASEGKTVVRSFAVPTTHQNGDTNPLGDEADAMDTPENAPSTAALFAPESQPIQADFERPQAPASDASRRVLEQMHAIFDKHENIVKKLNLPPPYIEVTNQ